MIMEEVIYETAGKKTPFRADHTENSPIKIRNYHLLRGMKNCVARLKNSNDGFSK